MKIGDRVNVHDKTGRIMGQGTIVEFNKARPLKLQYAVKVDGWFTDKDFYGEDELSLINLSKHNI